MPYFGLDGNAIFSVQVSFMSQVKVPYAWLTSSLLNASLTLGPKINCKAADDASVPMETVNGT